ncbi:GNAT family N-acetyltransferase [Salinimicrobium tongyeongense]|uniref:GNAT family N-acetyltransferase n=1 Tax=Salinimicrobium tongyeongense TaxID=2809707 RepID=A0ABY6NRP7_9FLAO|nr:GNAT family N-acetyltransferase [Salinimicrobium tongyeongense]UZH55508.1 GNAT family N-acetyltransferase [Salinimicrobium tongyeongense]
MRIREATEKDIPEIVMVLKASLGEKDLALSEEIWQYKHIKNPFGKSLVFIAEEDESIVGVRAFMRWQWNFKQKKFSCFRAVDTATLPEHQGKGIFKKLTLTALDLAKEEKASFVFNTPNEKSRPGYLKMGWEEVGKIEVTLYPAFNSFWKLFRNEREYSVEYRASFSQIEKLCREWNKKLSEKNLHTLKSADYLKWRYENNPLRNYEVLGTENFYLAGYIQFHRGVKELRIVESIFINPQGQIELRNCIKRWSFKFGAQLISFSPKLLGIPGPTVKGNFGPVLTVREILLTPTEMDISLSKDKWDYSLGDLELF